jgi:DNA-binding CsgD family transcriptional regulator
MIMNPSPQSSALPDVDCESLVAGIVTDPQLGVTILRLSGDIVYTNEPAVGIFLGGEKTPGEVLGGSLWSFFPETWVKELADFGAQVVRSGEPAMVRTVWLGRQVLSWVTPLDADSPASEARLLVVSRFAPDLAGGENGQAFKIFESRFISLGDLDILSPRELEVLALVGQGLSIREIAAMLHRSEKTIQNHRDSIGAKLNLPNRVHVAAVARRAGLKQDDAEKTRV